MLIKNPKKVESEKVFICHKIVVYGSGNPALCMVMSSHCQDLPSLAWWRAWCDQLTRRRGASHGSVTVLDSLSVVSLLCEGIGEILSMSGWKDKKLK